MTLNDAVSEMNKIKILIADDDPPTRMLLRAAIKQWGYDALEASDGEDAWEQLQKKDPPQLLISDWMMPRLDGVNLCKRIKTEMKIQPYIILLTQMTGTTNIITGLEAGADEFLSKPFNMAELRSRISVGARLIYSQFKVDQQEKQLQSYKKGFSQEKNNELISKELKSMGELLNLIEKDLNSESNGSIRQKISELKNKISALEKTVISGS